MDEFDIACFVLILLGVAAIAMGMKEVIAMDEE